MVHSLTPSYLTSLIHPTVNETSNYNLGNSNDIRTVNASSVQYYSSFLPSAIREWNTFPEEQRNSSTVTSFKNRLNQYSSFTPKHYYTGDRHSQILHTRLRTKCSSLNYDIFVRKLNDSPFCRCGNIENAEHFLLLCRFYHRERIEMLNSVSQLCHVTLDVLLYGDSSRTAKSSYLCINLLKIPNAFDLNTSGLTLNLKSNLHFNIYSNIMKL